MKTFKDFLLEATLKGNPSFSNDYLDDYTEYMMQRYQGQFPREYMQTINKMMNLQNGHEQQLENIAKEIIKEFYGSILDGIELDVKIIKPGDDEQMEMGSKLSFQKPPNFEIKKIEDEEIKLEIDKRKIINNIIQGESFNTFKLFQLAKDDVDRINPELYELYNKIIDDSYTLYWRIPEEQQVEMAEQAPQYGNYFQVIFGEQDEQEGEEDEQEQEQSSVTIKVRALDLASLIHEIVKGVYELIAIRGIPSDAEIAQIVLTNTDTYWDEIEDLRYGPKIASDIRDFINKNTKIGDYPNLREFVFGSMVDPKITSNQEFIDLIKGILTNTTEARQKIDELVDMSIEEIKNYENPENVVDFQKYFDKPTSEPTKPEQTPEKDYVKLTEPEFKTEYSKMEIELNKSLDDNNMNKVKVISNEMKKLKDEFQKKYNKEFVPRDLKI